MAKKQANPLVTDEMRAALSLAGKIGANESWGRTKDRPARTAPAREALAAKFLAEADGDPVRAEHIKKAHFQRLALKSAQTRRKAREAREALAAAEAARIKAGVSEDGTEL